MGGVEDRLEARVALQLRPKRMQAQLLGTELKRPFHQCPQLGQGLVTAVERYVGKRLRNACYFLHNTADAAGLKPLANSSLNLMLKALLSKARVPVAEVESYGSNSLRKTMITGGAEDTCRRRARHVAAPQPPRWHQRTGPD